MRRREFITLLGGAAAAWPLGARAQEAGRAYRLGVMVGLPRASRPVAAFFDELRMAGFAEGQNLVVVAGGFGLSNELSPALAAEIVKLSPDVIWSIGGDPRTRALQELTKTIPIVTMSDDMVGTGLAQSLARPDGNTTGISILAPELDGKRQEILIETVPGVRRMAALADPKVGTPKQLEMLQETARRRGVDLAIYFAGTPAEIVPAMDKAKAEGATALNVLATALFSIHRGTVLGHAAVLRLPAIYQWPEMAEEGGLAAYGPRLTEVYRQVARVVAKIFRGAKPANIPVEQPTKFELVINLKTAKALGLTVPQSILLRADEVIQ
jgi:putative tryptophan/tyrosine transport system substrate-binding protein